VIVKMSKLTLLGLESQREELIKIVIFFGDFEISAVYGEEYGQLSENPALQDEISRID